MCWPSDDERRHLLTTNPASSTRDGHPGQQGHTHADGNSPENPSMVSKTLVVALYVMTGCTQPLLMTLLRTAGLTDPSCQLYMMFYYFGPACAIFVLWSRDNIMWPGSGVITKACGISFWDIAAQTLNYTGASLAGPAIFAIVYASVTIWAALFSQAFLGRRMNIYQWMAVVLVFVGLALTAVDSEVVGPGVLHGLLMVVIGTMMHGLFYVMSEAVMTKGEDRLSVEQNCAVQGLTASASFLAWQFVYTLPNVDVKLWEPMRHAGTSISMAIGLLVVFSAVSFLHSITFYFTLRHLSGGATSAGVFKGLQAVLVFVLTHLFYCGRLGGSEMCFSTMKFMSLATVSIGVLWYGSATIKAAKSCAVNDGVNYDSVIDETVLEIIGENV